MVTYGGMAKKPVTVSTSAFMFKVFFDRSPMPIVCIVIGGRD